MKKSYPIENQKPNPGEDAAHTAQTHANEGDVAVQSAQVDAMWAAYNACRSAEDANQKAEWLNAEILDGNPNRGDVRGKKTDDMTDEEAEMLFYDAAAANAVAKGNRADRYRNKDKHAKRRNRTPQHGFLPVPCRKKCLDVIPEGALPNGKQKRVCWYTKGRRKVVKLTPKGEPYKLNSKRTREWDSSKKPVWRPRPCYMLEPPEEPINDD